MANARKIRWGILGTLWISDVVANAIKESDTSELTAIGSRDATRASNFAKKHGISAYYTDYQQLLQDPEVDAIYIGLPNHLHKEWIIKCAKAGKHILCEKPFVLDPEEAREALTVVQENRVFCMEGLMYRCHPFIKQLQELIASSVIGEMQSINAVYTANIAAVANKTAGGAIRSLGCYPISLIRLLAREEPVKVIAHGQLSEDTTADRMSTAILAFNSGLTATVMTADNIDKCAQFTVFGTKGILEVKTNPWLPGKTNQVSVKVGDKVEIMNFTAEKDLFTYEIDYAANQIKNRVCSPGVEGVTWEHSKGNVAVLNEWLRGVKSSALNELTLWIASSQKRSSQ